MKSRQASAASTSTSAGRGRLVRGVRRLARAQQRLGRDARPVRALAADELALDERDAQAALGERAGAVLAGRAAADDDDVVVAHVRQLRAGLLGHHVRGVPVGPVRVGLAGALLVLAVGGRRAPQRARQVARRGERRLGGVDAAGQPRRDLLQQPAVAVRVAERGERAVAGVIGRRPADATAAVGLELAARVSGWNTSLTSTPRPTSSSRAASMSETIRYRPWAEPGAADVMFVPNWIEQPRAGRRELDDPEAVVEGEVGVEPPPEAPRRTPSRGRRPRRG